MRGGILFGAGEQSPPESTAGIPGCFRDLNLDQVVEAITSGYGEDDAKRRVRLADRQAPHTPLP